MQQVVTEIYIAPFSGSTDYVKIDLFNNESINLKYTQKDLTDLSKVFAPYSLSFTIPATPKNRQALLFFGDTDVQKANITGSFPCKIYTDGNLNLTGNFTVEDAKYDFNGMTNIQGSFETDFKSLKERIGDDLITDLGSVLTGSTSLQYSPTVAKNSIESKQLLLKELDMTSIGTTSKNDITINYITPLASTNRVWSYDEQSDVIDNIAYETIFSGVTNSTAILTEELRPAISYRALVEMMFKKYDLKVNLPLRSDKLFNEMYVWVNGATSEEKLKDENALNYFNNFNNQYPQLMYFDALNQGVVYPPHPNPVDVAPGFSPSFFIGADTPFKYTVTNTIRNGYGIVKINIGDKATSSMPDIWTLQRTSKSIRLNVQLTSVVMQTTGGKITISLRKPAGDKTPSECEEILTASVDMVAGDNNVFVDIPDTVFDNYTEGYNLYPTFEAYILFKADLASWTTTNIFTQYGYANGEGGWLQGYNLIAQTCVSDGQEKFKASGGIDLIQSLPKIKVVDFFQSFLKTFNLSIYNPLVNSSELQILNSEDINETGKIYGKREVDYTPFVNVKSYTKSVQDKYTKYNFKHATSKYKSNVDYVAGNSAGLEYGQVTQDNGASKKSEYSVITNYTIIPPRGVVNTNLVTYYGFSNELEEEEDRYKPINNELVLFVNNELAFLNAGVRLGFLIDSTNIVPLNRYMLMLPWFINAKQSLGFSVLIDDVSGDLLNKEKTNSLYERFYSTQTVRLLNVNVLSHKFDLFLPSSEIYVNPTRTNEPPTGFRLQNDIIIGETRYSVLDANIDITTGKTKLTLLNYITIDDTDKEVIPTPNMYSPDGYDSTQYQIQ